MTYGILFSPIFGCRQGSKSNAQNSVSQIYFLSNLHDFQSKNEIAAAPLLSRERLGKADERQANFELR